MYVKTVVAVRCSRCMLPILLYITMLRQIVGVDAEQDQVRRDSYFHNMIT